MRHGHSAGGKTSPTYIVWQAMLQRCTYQRHKFYRHYGGRGITVCERWQKFENFLADMGERPKDMTLERDDTDGNYEPANCRWATRAEQMQNRSISKLNADAARAIFSDTRTQRIIAREHGVSVSMVCMIKSGRCWSNVTVDTVLSRGVT